MKLILYDDNFKVIDLVEGIKKPFVNGNNVTWEDGSLSGINLPFLLLEDEVTVETVTKEILAFDKKNEYVKVDEIAQLQEENKMNAMAIMELAELLMGGE
jgi:hypothetical protein